MHQFLLNEGADPSRFLFCFSAMPIACFLLKNGMPQKNARPSAGALTGDGDSPGGNPVPFIISSTLRCCTCRLEPSGVCVADDPRTATTGNQRGVFTYPGRKPL